MRLHDRCWRLRWPLAGTGTHLWSQTYDRKLDDIFAPDKAVEYGDGGLSNEIETQNLFDKIHGDPRWLAFLRKDKAPEQPAKIEFKVGLPQADGNTANGPAHP